MKISKLNVLVKTGIDASSVRKIESLLKGIEKRIDKINNMKINVSVEVREVKHKWWEFWK